MTNPTTPAGYHTVTPFLTVPGAEDLIEFLKQAFDATETCRIPAPDGSIGHAELRIGDSLVMIKDTSGDCGTITGAFYLYVSDADAVYRQALAAGGESLMAPTLQFWGDRQAGVKDRFGTYWFIATRVEEVSPEELTQRMAALAAGK